jgi:ABC-type uncharacterized transport system auxiliary subunit
MKYLSLCLLILLVACGGTGPRTRYLIDPQAVVPAASEKVRGANVIRVTVPDAEFGLDTDRIQVQEANGHIVSISNALWVEPLGEMLEPLLIHTLEHSGKFRGVVDDDSAVNATLSLQTSIERFTLVYTADSALPHVEVALRMQLTRLPGDQLILSRRFTASAPVDEVRMAKIVPAFEAALADCLQQLTQTLSQQNRMHKPAAKS